MTQGALVAHDVQHTPGVIGGFILQDVQGGAQLVKPRILRRRGKTASSAGNAIKVRGDRQAAFPHLQKLLGEEVLG